MVTPEHAATALYSIVSLVLFWVVLYHFWREQRVDSFRHRLFTLRGELFDLALDRGLPFNDPAYTQFRTTLNGFLRFAHRLGFLSAFTATRFAQRHPEVQAKTAELEAKWQAALKEIPPDVAKAMCEIRMRMHLAVFRYLLFSSPIIVATLAPALVAGIMWLAGRDVLWPALKRRFLRARYRIAREVLTPLDALAFQYGIPSEHVSVHTGNHFAQIA